MTEQEQIKAHLAAMRLWDEQAVEPAADTASYVEEILSQWVPLAEHLGMFAEQNALQNLAVKMGYPEDYQRLETLLLESRMTCEMVFTTFALPIRSMLDELGIEYELKYRMKSVYSIWRKMRVDNKEFDDVYDLFAARIVYKPQTPNLLAPVEDFNVDEAAASVMLDTVAQTNAEYLTCWRIYAVVSMLYRIQPGRIKNWITHPKPSGYQALQLTVMGPDCNWIELQIRSERMDYEAEHGKAAHWLYKQEKSTF